MKLRSNILACLCVLMVAPSMAQESLAIKGGRVLTIAGEPIDAGVVLIRDGKIVQVGSDVSIPVEAQVIDATGKIVMPGFVEAHSSEAMSQANETNPNVPYVSVLDSIDPMRPYFDEARRNGVTTVAVVPGNSTMIGGQGSVIKTGGSFIDYMILKQVAGMKISLQPQGSSSRMGHLAALREELEEAKKRNDPKDNQADDNTDDKADNAAQAEGGQNQRGGNSIAQATDAALQQAMDQLVSGQMPAFIYCHQAMDVEQAIALAKEYKIQAILVLGNQCHKAAKLVADSGFPVILDSTLVFWETDPRTNEDKKIVLTEIFRQADVPFTFQVARGTNSTLGNNYLWYQAANAVKYGMPIEEALQSLTIMPARFLGVDKHVGSLEPGKDGDVVILTGDPLKIDTWVDTTIVNGKVVYERENDIKLKRLLGQPSEN